MLNSKPLLVNKNSPASLDKAIALIDFKRLEYNLSSKLMKEMPFASQRNLGSVALEWCWLAARRYHIYLHGKQHIWDHAGGNFILEKTGGFSCTLSGEEISSASLQGHSAVAAFDKSLFIKWADWLGVPTNNVRAKTHHVT